MNRVYSKWWIVGIIAAILATLPLIVIFVRNGGIPNVLPDYVDDASYYMSRMKQVRDGYPFIGNPYFKEHRSEMSGAFFVADWIATLPMFVGFSLPFTMAINSFVWGFIFASLLYLFGKFIGLSPPRSFWMTLGVFVATYWIATRPVSMQIVYPFFILFIWALYAWFQDPTSWKKTWFLILASSITFYVYTYLWQIVVIAYCILGVFALSKKNAIYRRGIIAGVITAMLASPIAWYSILQVQHPYYWDTMTRVGLVLTHGIGSAAVWYICLICFTAFFTYRNYRENSYQKYFLLIISGALCVATVSNVFSGKDLETAVHIGRFVELWFFVFFFGILVNKVMVKELRHDRGLFALIFVLLVISLGDFSKRISYLYEVPLVKEYENVLSWTRTNIPKDSVILTSDRLSTFLVLGTDTYPVFHPNGELYLMPSEKVIDRYLISRTGTIDREKIIKELRLYAGAGNAEHQFRTHNRNVKYCNLAQLDVFGVDCGTSITAVQNKGEQYFDTILKRDAEIKKSLNQSLKDYGVQYIISDKQSTQFVIPSISLKTLYEDERFKILEII